MKPENTVRTHDNLYANEDRSQKPKEYFKWLVELARANYTGNASPDVIDVGCASGDFLYHFAKNFPDAKLTGLDFMQTLLDAAAPKIPSAKLIQGSVDAPDFSIGQKFDLAFMSGVHSIFDAPENWVKNFANLLKDKTSVGFIFGLFNPYPFDVLLRVREAGQAGEYETGWNSISQKTTETEFAKHNCSVEFLEWNIPIDIEKNEADYLRSWSEPMADGKRMITSGIRLVHDFNCAIIRKN